MKTLQNTKEAVDLYADVMAEQILLVAKLENPTSADMELFKKTYVHALQALVTLAKRELQVEIERDMNDLKSKKLV